MKRQLLVELTRKMESEVKENKKLMFRRGFLRTLVAGATVGWLFPERAQAQIWCHETADACTRCDTGIDLCTHASDGCHGIVDDTCNSDKCGHHTCGTDICTGTNTCHRNYCTVDTCQTDLCEAIDRCTTDSCTVDDSCGVNNCVTNTDCPNDWSCIIGNTCEIENT